MHTSSALQSRREGFALPMAVLLIGFLTVGIMAAFARVEADYQVVGNQVMQTDAFGLAETGLNLAIARRIRTPADTTYTLPGGSAQVTITLAYASPAVKDTIYLVRSRGLPTRPQMHSQGRHTAAQYMVWQSANVTVKAAFTSLNGMHYNGQAGAIDGNDHCGPNATAPLAGVYTPKGTYTYAGTPSGHDPPLGSPPVDSTKTKAQMIADLGIDWGSVTSGGVSPDFVFETQAAANAGWPFPSADSTYWPVIYIKNGTSGSFTMPSSGGRGTIIVEGNVTINGATTWNGIVLVGGNLTADGNNNVLGATMTGMNEILGISVPNTVVMNGTKTYAYHSCNIANAAGAFAGLRPLQNAWADAFWGN